MTSLTRGDRALALVGVVLLALGMRPATSAVAPVFATIDAELHLGNLVLGVIGAVPLLSFAVAGLTAPRVARTLGVEAAILVGIGAIVLGQVVRSLASDAAGMVGGTVVAMLGIGVVNVLLPPVVRTYFPSRIGRISAMYLTLVGVGATLPSLVAVPLTESLGWRITLAAWAFAPLLAAAPWLRLALGKSPTPPVSVPDVPAPPTRIAREPIAWGLIIVMIGATSTGYCMTAWLPSILREVVGSSPAEAAAQTAPAFAIAIPAMLIVPALAVRAGAAPVIIGITAFAGVAGWLGILVAPGVSPVVWSLLIGIGSTSFPLVIVEIAARAATPQIAAPLSGFVQGIGYLTTAGIVFGVGVLRSQTDGWTAPLITMAAIAALQIAAIAFLRSPRRIGE